MKDIGNLKKLEGVLGVTFSDMQYLLSAVTHRSFLNENRDAAQSHNERLEFLGDAVLELVVTDFLFKTYPDKQEGELTAIRAALVNTNTLSLTATRIGINEYLLLSKGESKDIGRARQYILANTFESIVGAIYLDRGYERATSSRASSSRSQKTSSTSAFGKTRRVASRSARRKCPALRPRTRR